MNCRFFSWRLGVLASWRSMLFLEVLRHKGHQGHKAMDCGGMFSGEVGFFNFNFVNREGNMGWGEQLGGLGELCVKKSFLFYRRRDERVQKRFLVSFLPLALLVWAGESGSSLGSDTE